MAFGNRPEGSGAAQRVLVETPHGEQDASPTRRISAAKALLIGLGIAVFSVAGSIYFERAHGGPADLASDVVVEAGPYVAGADCPRRVWSAGEYLPRACMKGNFLRGAARSAAGLEAPRDGRHAGFVSRWIRAGDDVLLVRLPRLTSGRIDRVISARFAPAAGPEGPPPSSDAARYDRPPFDYLVGAAVGHGQYCILLLVIFALAPLFRRWERTRPKPAPAAAEPVEPAWMSRATAGLADLQQAPPKA